MAMAYGTVYVAQIAMGASPQQTLDALREAETYDGPSLVIAYGHCIAHGIEMRLGLRQQKLAADCGHWPLYRFQPAGQGRLEEVMLDSPPPSIPLWRGGQCHPPGNGGRVSTGIWLAGLVSNPFGRWGPLRPRR
jgi:pyruvate-ferredoxin/flavodoxin oxidoreductase